MILNIRKPKGRRPKNNNFTKLTNLLFEKGFSMPQICAELHISKVDYKMYFSKPTLFSLERIKTMSFMTGLTMAQIENLCTGYDSANRHWFDEQTSKTARERVEEIKNEQLKDK